MNRGRERWIRPTLGDLGGAVGGLNQDITTLGAQSRSHSLGQSVNTLEELGTSLDTELEVLQSERKKIVVSIGCRRDGFSVITEEPTGIFRVALRRGTEA